MDVRWNPIGNLTKFLLEVENPSLACVSIKNKRERVKISKKRQGD